MLREQTRTEHEATEALMPLAGEGLTREVYLRTLGILFPLLASWEQWSAEAAPAELRGMLAARRRSHLLASDLREMGGVPAAVLGERPVDWGGVVGASTEGPAGKAAFLGAMYVLEGSTLGGRYIARHVESILGIAPGVGDAYFQGHGEATGAMWREVTARIAEVPDAHAAVVIQAARRAFQAFGQALSAGAVTQKTDRG